MKRQLSILATLLALNLFALGCESPAQKRADAEQKAEQADRDVRKAQADANAKQQQAGTTTKKMPPRPMRSIRKRRSMPMSRSSKRRPTRPKPTPTKRRTTAVAKKSTLPCPSGGPCSPGGFFLRAGLG